MSEASIQSKIIKYLNGRGIFNFKVIAANISGIPDICCVINGRVVFLEVKTAKGKTSPLQDYQMRRISLSGGLCYVVRSLEDVKEVIDAQNT